MSLRLRLIVAFFVLSVVPLGAVTMLSYRNNVAAVRTAAGREADLLAGELTQRMQLVTAQLSERVEHLMDLPEAGAAAQVARASTNPAAPPASAANAPPASSSAATSPGTSLLPPSVMALVGSALAAESAGGTIDDKVAQVLGDAAVLLNTVELQGLRTSGRGGGQAGRDGRPPDRSGQRFAPGTDAGRTGGGSGQTTRVFRGSGSARSGRTGAQPGGTPPVPGAPPPPAPPPVPVAGDAPPVPPAAVPQPPAPTSSPSAPRPTPQRAGRAAVGAVTPAVGAAPRPSGTPDTVVSLKPADAAGAARGQEARDRILIDLAPIRRELYREILPGGRADNLTAEERQRIAREINQRMLGIVQGLKLGAEGLEKAAAAEREAKPRPGVTAPPTPPRPAGPTPPAAPPVPRPSPVTTKTALKGSTLGVTLEQDGQVVQQVSAEINLPNVLAAVFTTTPRERGEIPFAIGPDGQVHTPSEPDKARIQALGPEALSPTGPPTRTTIHREWIVVTSADPSGSGLRFGIARPVGDSMADLRRAAARNASFGLLFIAIALVGIVPISGRLTRNLTSLTDAVSRIAHGDFRARVPVQSRDEIGRLASAFNRMAEDVERHQRSAVEQERIRRELELGRQIQSEMLPHAPLRLGLTQVKGVSIPAREVGGDFFNYFEVGEGRVALLVGDVSGKGVGAALLMANIQASLRTRLGLGQDLAAIADAIDRDIEANSPGPVYATLFVAILDPATRRLRYVNAGHHPQYVLSHGRPLERMASTGLPVGLLSGHGYHELEVQLAAGDLLFFYTDGFVEAENRAGDMFGPERLEALVGEVSTVSPDEVLEHVEAAVKRFRGDVEPADDETMMAVKIG